MEGLVSSFQHLNDGRRQVPPADIPTYNIVFNVSFSSTNSENVKATFDLTFDEYLKPLSLNELLFGTLSDSLKEKGFSFDAETNSVEGIQNKNNFQTMIIPILEKGMDELVDKKSDSISLESSEWQTSDYQTFESTLLVY